MDAKIESIEQQIEQTEQLKKGLMQQLLTQGIGHTEFKDTEIGRIPKSWEVKKLDNVCERVCVGFVGTCEKYYTTPDLGVKMIRTGNLKNGNLILEDLKYVMNEFHQKNKKSQIIGGELLIARHGDSGQSVMYPYDIGESNCLNIVIVRPQKSVDSIFLKNQFNSSLIRNQINKKTAGSTQGVVNTKEIATLNFVIPSLSEQETIADIFETADEKTDILVSKKQSYETLKKGLMQKLLTGQIRVKVD